MSRVGTTPSPARALSVARRPLIAPGSASESGSCSQSSRLRSTTARGIGRRDQGRPGGAAPGQQLVDRPVVESAQLVGR